MMLVKRLFYATKGSDLGNALGRLLDKAGQLDSEDKSARQCANCGGLVEDSVPELQLKPMCANCIAHSLERENTELRECLIAMLSNFGGIACAKTHPYDWDRWRKAAFPALSNNRVDAPSGAPAEGGSVQ